MKRFLFKAALFALPFAILLGFPLLVLIMTGEFTSVEDVVEMQQEGRPVLFGKAYSSEGKPLQLAAALRHAPDVVTIGNSRVSQFRRGFFRNDVSFYNAAMAASSLKDISYFLDQLPDDQSPRLLIIGLEHWWFNQKFYDYDQKGYPERFQEPSPSDIFERNWRHVWTDYFDGKFDLHALRRDDHRIGLSARAFDGIGHLNDGSLYYGQITSNPDNPELKDYNFRFTFGNIENAWLFWGYGQDISQISLDELRHILEVCATRDIEVIAFLPIYAEAVYEKLQFMSPKYEYLFKLEEALLPIVKEYGFEFYNFSNITWVGSSDREALDGNHGSVKSHVRMMLQLADSGSVIKEYVDEDHLRRRLREVEHSLELFPPNI